MSTSIGTRYTRGSSRVERGEIPLNRPQTTWKQLINKDNKLAQNIMDLAKKYGYEIH